MVACQALDEKTCPLAQNKLPHAGNALWNDEAYFLIADCYNELRGTGRLLALALHLLLH